MRRKLEALRREPCAIERTPAHRNHDGPYKRIAARDTSPVARPLICDRQERTNGSGSYCRMRISLLRFWNGSEAVHQARSVAAPTELSTEPATFVDHYPNRTLFLDLETCGFSGSSIFLIGLLHDDGDGLAIDLLLARDYSEERAILEAFWQVVEGHQVLVTFNGKCFDWPMLRDRRVRHRFAECLPDLVHFDLLHHARRRWKQGLPDCKLQTLERYICGRFRTGDVPGRLVPAVYHEFVRNRDWRRMEPILMHNALDLVTLLELALRVAGMESA